MFGNRISFETALQLEPVLVVVPIMATPWIMIS